eukprot:TRINITY_DN5389_c0_g1_i1.p1 TRINITY_DN5389_c0_g1~~TRINITY_DN5389_c0_g1_i1.p1  ORF type:complete len:555 (+),score=73.33 TRINITY_DN5389_c0_g1_i1:177-1841(+)
MSSASSPSSTSNRRSVCIIGAGVSGLISAKVFLEDGDKFDITVYEKTSDIAGVWSDRAYSTLRTNNARHTFGFADLDIPKEFGDYPTAPQMRSYFNAYADKFKLREKIILNTTVTNVVQISEGASDPKWEVTIRSGTDTATATTTEVTYDYVIVATGMFEQPFIPIFENADSFKGTILHSSQVRDKAEFKDKRVLIIGGGKSAADMATLACGSALSTRMIFRKAHWIIPEYVMGKISTRWVLYSRAISNVLPYYKMSPMKTFLHRHLPFIPRGVVNFIKNGIVQDMHIQKGHVLIPEGTLLGDVSICMEPKGFYDAVRKELITFNKTSVRGFVPHSNTVLFDDGTSGEYDVVVMGTGFLQGFRFFSSKLTSLLGLPSQGCQSGRTKNALFKLYRHIVPINGPKNIGFVGFAEALTNASCYELQAHWLTEYFLGHLQLPSSSSMDADISSHIKHEAAQYRETGEPIGMVILTGFRHYFDVLVSDLKVSHGLSTNFMSENFSPFNPTQLRYIQIEKVALRRSQGGADTTTRSVLFYFSFYHFLLLVAAILIAFFYF